MIVATTGEALPSAVRRVPFLNPEMVACGK